MHATVRELHSPDIDNLATYEPPETDKFSFLLQIIVGPSDAPGEEAFDVVVCTPRWLLGSHASNDIVIGRHLLIVFKYDYVRLRDFLTARIAEAEGVTWRDVAQIISRIGRWEFEDYTPAKPR